jgi:Carboxypeptidase regulatory-like domain/TonB dependent receptor
MKITFRLSALGFVLLCAAGQAFGQSDRATITGTVSDTSGALLPGVHVLVTNVDQGTAVEGNTNNAGIYTISDLPIGNYTLTLSRPGFKNYTQAGIALITSQVLQVNVNMEVGSSTETVTVAVAAALLETETSSVATTMEESAIRDLPLNAASGRDALNLLLQATPNIGSNTSLSTASGGQSWIYIAGGEALSNSIFVDGVDATAGDQGQISTPGQDALQEMQLQTNVTDAEVSGTGGGAIQFELKSGTNQFHGSVFEFLQNEDLNANTWANKYWDAVDCAPPNNTSACTDPYRRGRFRFNDYGGSAGGPLWKNHTFIFGDYEYYDQTDNRTNPGGLTVPTPQMLTGDFSQLLTGGANQGTILNSDGTPWINPCTGQAYQYGQIFDPQTQQIVNGQTCATPFPGNIIPAGRLSAQSQKVAAIYTQLYTPRITSRIYSNFPAMVSSLPVETKRTVDIKVDHYLSDKHHISASFDTVALDSLNNTGGFAYSLGSSDPFSSFNTTRGTNTMVRVIDNYTLSATLLNTFSIGFSRTPSIQGAQQLVDAGKYGFSINSNAFPLITYGNSSNGVLENSPGLGWDLTMFYNAFHYQDSVSWLKGRHSFKFGGEFTAQQLNSSTLAEEEQNYNFASDTGGPIDPSLSPYVGNGFSSFMLGAVFNANLGVPQFSHPRQKSFDLFVQDNFKVTSRLTLNLGVRWDVTLPGHDQAGQWENFDLTAVNPAWAPYPGAWEFSKNSGTTFQTNNDLHQFGPHVGGAYQLSNKLVARASYGIFYVPLGSFSSGAGDNYPASQDPLAYGTNNVLNNNEGTIAFNWDGGYPGQTVYAPQNSSATVFQGDPNPYYINPKMLHLGYTQNLYAGVEYELAKNLLVSARIMGNRGSNLHDFGRSVPQNSPNYSAEESLVLAGNVYNFISDAGDAAASGVPYPYPGFQGPAYAAVAPYPQAMALGYQVVSAGDPKYNSQTAYNAFVIDVKARKAYGLYTDYSYTISKQTGSQLLLDNFTTTWGTALQSPADYPDSKHWINVWDQRQLLKGVLTYDLPFGRGKQWLSRSRLLDHAVGGWTLGFQGNYGSGLPFTQISSNYSMPYYFSGSRANFANGATADNMKNQFHGRSVDLNNLNDPGNTDFNPSSFASTTPQAPFGNSPYAYNKWRWNPGAASENMSVLKHFSFGSNERYSATLRAEFYDVFNRHYLAAPDTGIGDATFGQVTTVYGNRTGQLGARFQW